MKNFEMRNSVVFCLAMAICINKTEGGASYVRWGRSVCPSGSNLLYAGYIAGPRHDLGGSGSNYLCMHNDPQFVNAIQGHQNPSGYIYGVEFDLAIPAFEGLLKTDNIPGENIVNNDMVCAVCQVPVASDQLMIPGRQDCANTGYRLQYKGFLVSEYSSNSHSRTQYLCVDEAPEGRIGGNGNDNQGVLYPVQLGCGSLPCNPYVDGYEVTCAVCTN